MHRDFKLRNKLSFSPNRTHQNVFTMRARIGKKPKLLNSKLRLDPNPENNRHFSQSAHKLKPFGNKLFSGAHKIDSKQTYLLNEKVQKQSKTKESSAPMSPSNAEQQSKKISPALKILKSRSSSKMDVTGRGQKDIQRTVSIAIKGKKEDLPSQEQLMSTLSHIILGGQKALDDFYLQIVGESSIHGQEQNFIELESFIFKDQELTEYTNIHKE